MRLFLFSLFMLAISAVSYFLGRIYAPSEVTKPSKQAATKADIALTISGTDFSKALNAALETDSDDENQKRVRIKNEVCRIRTGDTLCGEIDESNTNVLLIGDSFGRDGINSLAIGYPSINLLVDVVGGCPLVPDVTLVTYSNKECPNHNTRRFREIERILPDIDTVVLSIRITRERVIPIQKTIAWLRDRNARVVVLGNPPMFKRRRLPDIILEHGKVEGLNEFASEWLLDLESIDDDMEFYVSSNSGMYIRRRDHLCPQSSVCNVLIDGNYPITVDSIHQSYAAAVSFGEYLAREYPDLLEPI